MGGSGGRFYSDNSSQSSLASAATNDVKIADFSAKVGQYFSELLSDANSRDTDATKVHLEEIRNAIAAEIEETIDMRFGGSVSKETHFEGLSDVDCLAILKHEKFKNLSPNEVKERFAQVLRDRFPKTTISVGDLAITVKFSDMEIQVLPALKTVSGVCIAEKSSTGWKEVYPQAFREALSEVNQNQGGQVIPLIKIAKKLFAKQPEQRQPEGYHLECLAVEAFRNYSGEKIQRSMLHHLLNTAANSVNQPMHDVTGQSTSADGYLGEAGSLQRRNLADAFSTLARRLKNAEETTNFDKWKKVFEG